MSLIDILFGKKTKTATVARDRLQIIHYRTTVWSSAQSTRSKTHF